MPDGAFLTYATIEAAWILYLGAVAAWLAARPKAARAAWIAGCVLYLGHVAAAFAFHHDWSHRAAYQETASQTAALFGVAYGGGIFFNYAFTGVWTADAAWILLRPESYRRRPLALDAVVHGFLAFMFFNATVVFGSGWIRWSGILATAALGAWWLLRRRRGR